MPWSEAVFGGIVWAALGVTSPHLCRPSAWGHDANLLSLGHAPFNVIFNWPLLFMVLCLEGISSAAFSLVQSFSHHNWGEGAQGCYHEVSKPWLCISDVSALVLFPLTGIFNSQIIQDLAHPACHRCEWHPKVGILGLLPWICDLRSEEYHLSMENEVGKSFLEAEQWHLREACESAWVVFYRIMKYM